VSTAKSKPPVKDEVAAIHGGLFRTVLAGAGRTLLDAFANLEGAAQVERLFRHSKRDLLSARVTLTPQEGQGYWELTRIRNDIYIIVENYSYKNPRVERLPGDGLVQFNFKVSGDMTVAVSRKAPLRLNRPSLFVWSQPTGVESSEWTAPAAYERNVAISMRPQFLIDNFLTTPQDVPERLQVFMADTADTIPYCQIPLSAQMFDAVTRLINNPFSGARALVYSEALALELLCGAVEAFCSLSTAPAEEYTDRELRCLRGTRDTLLRQLAPPPTIHDLARSVGISETALTRGFKSVYGETIFDFSIRCRMQQALTLLRDKHLSVDEVADAVGYRHPTSFATAFRRHFGVRPIDVKRVKS
jgi:AraC-like DNA-binding protein